MSKEYIRSQKGLIICNIGTGKGKTTAAMGIAARASGAGLNVFILQFVKARGENENEDKNDPVPLSAKGGSGTGRRNDEDRKAAGEWPVSNEIKFFQEVKIPSGLGRIETEVCGEGFVGILGDQKEKDEHMRAALQGLERAHKVLVSGEYEVIILDEIISAVELNLITEEDVLDVIKKKPDNVHLVLTGHNKYPKILKLCDTVTEMKMIKHGYYEGVLAQEGIDY